jgi:hypothetical protein
MLRLAAAALCAAAVAAAPFAPGNIVALRLGSASAPFASAQLQKATAAAFLDEFSPQGALVQSIALPASAAAAARLGPGSARLTVSSQDAFAGGLSRSQDGALLLLGGFDADSGAAGVDATWANSTARVVAKVSAGGAVDTTTRVRSAFHGNPTTGAGGCIRFAASDDGTDVYAAGTNALDGAGIVFVNQTVSAARDTAPCVGGDFRGCDIHEDRLFATGADGWLYAIEDLRSVRPGLPDKLYDLAYPPSARKISQAASVDAAIAGLDVTGAYVEGSTAAWVASGDAARCLDQYALNDYTPTDYVFSYGYLDGGVNDLFGGATQLLDLAGAKALCDSLDQCAGFTFFYNASFYSPVRPWTPQTKVSTYMKGPFFWFTRTGSGREGEVVETWYSFQKPSTSGNFNFSAVKSVGGPCSGAAGGGRGGFFGIAADDESVPGRVPYVYLSAGDGSALLKYDTASGATTLLAAAPAGSVFRGIALAPTTGAPAPPSSSNGGGGGAGAPSGAVAGTLIALFLLASCGGGYAWTYHKQATQRALGAVGERAAALAEAVSERLGGGGGGGGRRGYRRGEGTALMAPGVSPPRPVKV